MAYSYRFTNSLSPCLPRMDKDTHVFLAVYVVQTSGKTPFLQYLLADNGCDFLSLPKISSEHALAYAPVYLSVLLQVSSFAECNKHLSFEGCREYDHDVYLFFDATACMPWINVDGTTACFGLIDEIMNYKSVCQRPIDYRTCMFFLRNDDIAFLYDDSTQQPYEIPVVAFVGKPTAKKAQFTRMFGESARTKSAILGPYFYFTSYENAYNEVCNEEKEKNNVVRFALLVGKTKYIENHPNDPIDTSDMKKQRLEDPTLERNKEIQTLRISDHDGLWAKTYDSAYLGNLTLDDGSLLEEAPLLVVREYSQQIPL